MRVPREKPLRARTRTNNKLTPHMTPSPGIEPGPHWWDAIALTSAPLCFVAQQDYTRAICVMANFTTFSHPMSILSSHIVLLHVILGCPLLQQLQDPDSGRVNTAFNTNNLSVFTE